MPLERANAAIRRVRRALGRSESSRLPRARGASFVASKSSQWYDPILLNPASIGALATDATTHRAVLELLDGLSADDYLVFVRDYYREGLARFGNAWVYADILSVLMAASRLLRPECYLEIGVRRGRSLAAVLASSPDCRAVGFDLWMKDYAGMDNPGPELVREELSKLGGSDRIELVSGPSEETVPQYFRENPEAFFDLITVDGDHSERGATADLRIVIPRLKLGGVLVFDDIAHPDHPVLERVWAREVVGRDTFRTWEFTELGFGVGVAVRVS